MVLRIMMKMYWCSSFLLFTLVQNTDGHTHHMSAAGRHCKMCPPGTHWVSDCTSDGQQDTCVPCPAGYYQSWYNTAHWCVPCHTECPGQFHDPNIVQVAACTNTSNLRCACKEGFWMARHHKTTSCRVLSSCHAGKGVERPATDYSDTTCAPCRPGSTFSNINSKTEPCRDCTECGDTEDVATNCTAVKDTVCTLKQQENDIAAMAEVDIMLINTLFNGSARMTLTWLLAYVIICLQTQFS